jgi:Helicase HerA, central domain
MTLQPQQLCIGARISGDLVMLASDERRRHLYIIGQTGTGKSTLLLNLIAQDLAAGEGLALLDPHGDLAEAVLLHVPRDRTNDLVYINPADIERPIGFNPLSGVPEDLRPMGIIYLTPLGIAFRYGLLPIVIWMVFVSIASEALGSCGNKFSGKHSEIIPSLFSASQSWILAASVLL